MKNLKTKDFYNKLVTDYKDYEELEYDRKECSIYQLNFSHNFKHKYKDVETRFEISPEYQHISNEGVSVDFPLKGIRSLYGATKLAAEYILQEYSHNYNIPAIINKLMQGHI